MYASEADCVVHERQAHIDSHVDALLKTVDDLIHNNCLTQRESTDLLQVRCTIIITQPPPCSLQALIDRLPKDAQRSSAARSKACVGRKLPPLSRSLTVAGISVEPMEDITSAITSTDDMPNTLHYTNMDDELNTFFSVPAESRARKAAKPDDIDNREFMDGDDRNTSGSSADGTRAYTVRVARDFTRPPFICERDGCIREFDTAKHLSKHMANVHTSRRFDCPSCGRPFKKKDHMKRHVMMHCKLTPHNVKLETHVK
jgi:hypothetical protein